MKNDRIIASWNKIEPGDSANERMLSAILERNRSVQVRKDRGKYTAKTRKTLIPIAACLALLIAAAGIIGANLDRPGANLDRPGANLDRPGANLDRPGAKTDAGAGMDGTVRSGGSLPEGIDPVTASIAVFPADRSLEDVADAAISWLSEPEARSAAELGDHLPTAIPDGYLFSAACLYETTMKDGTKYRLLRVTYAVEDGSRDDMLPADDFTVHLTHFRPNTEKTVYTTDTLPSGFSDMGFLHIALGDVYVGFDPGDLTRDEVMSVLNSMS